MRKLLLLLAISPAFLFSQDNGRCLGNCSNGQGTWIWDDGEEYNGEWKNDDFHGYGTYKYASGSKYIG